MFEPKDSPIGPAFAPISRSAAVWDDDSRRHTARAVEIARAECTCNYPYHILWPILRAAGIKGTLRAKEDEVLAPLLSPLIGDAARILIAGSADTATLCTVGRISGARRPDFTVLDRCPAPLSLVREFAAERQISCRTLRFDLTELEESDRWDIVLVHYTFQFIRPDRRGDVMRRLARSLVPGGTLVCVDKEVPPVSLAEAPASAAEWLEKTRRKVRAEGLDSTLPAALYDELLRQAAEGRTIRRVTIPSAAGLIDNMHSAGLVAIQDLARQARATNGSAHPALSDSSIILAARRPDPRLETPALLG